MYANHYESGLSAFNEGNYEFAEGAFSQALIEHKELKERELDKKTLLDLRFYLGVCQFYNANYKESIHSLDQFLKGSGNAKDGQKKAQCFNLKGQCYEALIEPVLAITAYQNAVECDSAYATAHYNLGMLRLKAAEKTNKILLFKKAKQSLDNGLRLERENPVFLSAIATWHQKIIYCFNDDLEIVEEHCQKAIDYHLLALAKCPENDKKRYCGNLIEGFVHFGNYYFCYTEDRNKAKEYYNQALAIDPKHFVALNQIGTCYAMDKHYANARELFVKSLESPRDDNDLIEAWQNIARSYRCEKQLDEAQKALDEALNLDPDNKESKREQSKLNDLKHQKFLISSSQSLYQPVSLDAKPGIEMQSNFISPQ